MRLSLNALITSLFGILIAVAIGQGSYAVMSLRTIEAGMRQTIEDRIPAFILMGQLNTALGDARVAQASYLDADASRKQEFLAALSVATSIVEKCRSAYEALIVDADDRKLIKIFDESWKAAQDAWTTVRQLDDATHHEEAMALFLGTSLDLYNKTGDTIQAAVDDLKGNVETEGSAAMATIASAKGATYFALAFAVLVGTLAAFISRMRVIRPLVHITAHMRALSDGDTHATVPYQGRKDEVGGMAAALQIFKDGIIRNKILEAEAKSARERAETEKQHLQAEAEAAAQKKLQEATAGLATGLKRLAGGDLAFELKDPFAPEFESLRKDLNAAVEQLGATIAIVATSATSIGMGSREVSQSADDLSRRTEQQAAALEETAAALDQITVNVGNSAKRVEEARGVARQANSSAVQSGKVVMEAINAMQRIEQSSSQISNIIGVIDEIAFQTNLLALNAGVEAARAGEAGRGFAVVATEVRELAQRSARAAREIKELINNSTREVENGVRQVEETGEVLKAIEQHVVTINSLMDAIATSAEEQTVGLSEVNTAVNQMDQVTQQNAAMVEETSAASATLAQESTRLQQLVSGFMVRNSSTNHSLRAA